MKNVKESENGDIKLLYRKFPFLFFVSKLHPLLILIRH